MPNTTENVYDFRTMNSREFWITAHGDRKYAHEFEDDHLVNTIQLLHRKTRQHRLEEARDMCEMIHRFGNRGTPIENYYRHFKQEMDKFMDTEISDQQWLKENSKIYRLLVEEAEYRELDYQTVAPQKATISSTIPSPRRSTSLNWVSASNYIIQNASNDTTVRWV